MMEAILAAVIPAIKDSILNKIKHWHAYIKTYNENISKLEDNYKTLNQAKQSINKTIERENSDLRRTTQITEEWLENVTSFMQEDAELQELINKEFRNDKDLCCCGHLHYNPIERYSMSFKAEAKVKKIEVLIAEKPSHEWITEPVSRSDVNSVPSEFLKSLSSRVELMDKILLRLLDEQVNVVGLFGMGGVGKTTLVKEIVNEGARGLFDEVVIAEITKSPNVEQIQDQIAEQLGVSLTEHNQEERAIILYNRLKKVTDTEKQAANQIRRTLLIILDNIYKKLDLSIIGIPNPKENTKEFCCKLLLTSRNREVCEAMGASVTDLFEEKALDENEARKLFRERVGEIVKNDGGKDLKDVEEKLLKMCEGQPLTIVALADLLKDKELSFWKRFVNELGNSSRSRDTISGVDQHTCLILETSYNLIESEEKKMFFLLTCLFPLGSSIPVEEMMRYGIGLGLFQCVDNLTEALELANLWVEELKSSNLLLEDDHKGHVKIHDMVRVFTMSMPRKGVNMLMLDAFPRWLWEESCQEYNAISLRYPINHSRLNGLNSGKLQILILDGTQPRDRFPDTFFQGMTNLKVLVLKGMDFTMGLPDSIRKLKSLRSLHLEDCDLREIGDGISELTNLLVLSLYKTRIRAKFSSRALGKLSKLCLFDLRESEISTEALPAKFLSNLSELEGLYAFDSIRKWASIKAQEIGDPNSAENNNKNEDENEDASIDELNTLNHLKVLEMQVSKLQQLPVSENSDQFVKNLDKFFISISNDENNNNKHSKPNEILRNLRETRELAGMAQCNSRTLLIQNLDAISIMEKYKCINGLLNKADRLITHDVKGVDQFLDHHLQKGRLQGLKELVIQKNANSFGSTRLEFRDLERLWLIDMPNLLKIQHRQATLSKLRCLVLDGLLELQPYALPIHPSLPYLTVLHIKRCPKLRFLFKQEDENGNVDSVVNERKTSEGNIHYLPSLKMLILKDMDELESTLGVPNPASITGNEEYPQGVQASHVLFNAELIHPALEKVELWALNNITTIQGGKKYNCISSFRNLKILRIGGCQKLENLCSFSLAVVALAQLKTLTIEMCPRITQVITNDHEIDDDYKPKIKKHQQLLFSSLESLILWDCSNLQKFLLTNQNDVIEFPSLQRIRICYCDEMNSFSNGVSKAPKLNQFEINWVEYSKDEIGEDLSEFLQKRFQSQHKLASGVSGQRMGVGAGSKSEIQEVPS